MNIGASLKMNNVVNRIPPGRLAPLIAILLTGIAVVFPGGIACTSTPAPAEVEKVNLEVLNNSIACIKANHPDAAALLGSDISFSRVSATGKDMVGYTGVTYKGGGWSFSIGHAVVPDYAYDIRADYGGGKIVWVGSSKNGQVTEESYTKTP
jgi:hypothetical protein